MPPPERADPRSHGDKTRLRGAPAMETGLDGQGAKTCLLFCSTVTIVFLIETAPPVDRVGRFLLKA